MVLCPNRLELYTATESSKKGVSKAGLLYSTAERVEGRPTPKGCCNFYTPNRATSERLVNLLTSARRESGAE